MRSKSAPVRAVEARIRVVFTIVMVLMAEQGRAEEPFSLLRAASICRASRDASITWRSMLRRSICLLRRSGTTRSKSSM